MVAMACLPVREINRAQRQITQNGYQQLRRRFWNQQNMLFRNAASPMLTVPQRMTLLGKTDKDNSVKNMVQNVRITNVKF